MRDRRRSALLLVAFRRFCRSRNAGFSFADASGRSCDSHEFRLDGFRPYPYPARSPGFSKSTANQMAGCFGGAPLVAITDGGNSS